MLRALRGRSHEVVTGVVLRLDDPGGREAAEAVTSQVLMRSYTEPRSTPTSPRARRTTRPAPTPCRGSAGGWSPGSRAATRTSWACRSGRPPASCGRSAWRRPTPERGRASARAAAATGPSWRRASATPGGGARSSGPTRERDRPGTAASAEHAEGRLESLPGHARRFRRRLPAARRAAPRSARGRPRARAAAARQRPPGGWSRARPGLGPPRARRRRGRPRAAARCGPASPSWRPLRTCGVAFLSVSSLGGVDRDAHHLVERPSEDALDLRRLPEVDQDADPPRVEEPAHPRLLDHRGRQVCRSRAAPGAPCSRRCACRPARAGGGRRGGARPAGDARWSPGRGCPPACPGDPRPGGPSSRAAGATRSATAGARTCAASTCTGSFRAQAPRIASSSVVTAIPVSRSRSAAMAPVGMLRSLERHRDALGLERPERQRRRGPEDTPGPPRARPRPPSAASGSAAAARASRSPPSTRPTRAPACAAWRPSSL